MSLCLPTNKFSDDPLPEGSCLSFAGCQSELGICVMNYNDLIAFGQHLDSIWTAFGEQLKSNKTFLNNRYFIASEKIKKLQFMPLGA